MRKYRSLMFHPVRPHTRAGRFVISLVFAAFAALLLVLWAPAYATDSRAPAAESPDFFFDGAEPGVDRLPLKAKRVDVRIAQAAGASFADASSWYWAALLGRSTGL